MRRLVAVAGLSLVVSMGAVACGDEDESGDAPTPTTATEAGAGTGGDSGVGTGTTSGVTAPEDGMDTDGTVTGTDPVGDGTDTGGGTGGSMGGESLTIDFEPVNDSGVTGTGTVTPGPNGRLTVAFTADGLVADRMHLQHIHEPDGQSAKVRCPTEQDDADGDGVVSLQEAEPAYGPVRLDLSPYPNARGGSVQFERTYTVPQRFRPLTDGAVVIHGGDVGGTYDETVPVACALVGEG